MSKIAAEQTAARLLAGVTLTRTNAENDDDMSRVTITGLPTSILSSLLTQAWLYNHDEQEFKRFLDKTGGSCSCADCLHYNDEQLAVFEALTKMLSKSSNTTQPVKPLNYWWKSLSPEQLSAHSQAEGASDAERLAYLTEHAEDPLPEWPTVQVLAKARVLFRRAVIHLGYCANKLTQGLHQSRHIELGTTQEYLSNVVVLCTEASAVLATLKPLLNTSVDFTIDDVHLIPWEAGY